MKKLNKLKKIYIVPLFLLVIWSCEDVFEENIEDDQVVVLTPENESRLESNSVQFTWETLEGATHYRIRATRRDTQRLVLDSLVEGDNFLFGLAAGEYSWQMRGENFGYVTSYSPNRTFTLIASDNLENQEIFLTVPTDDFATRDNSVRVGWDRIATADRYVLEVTRTIGNATTSVLTRDDLTQNSFNIEASDFDTDGIYTWRVKAVNTTTNTETPFKSRRILRDTQAPTRPSLTAPNAGMTSANRTVNFSWSLGSDTGEVMTPVSSHIEIAIDQNFTNSSIIETRELTTSTHEYTFANAGTFYWRVRVEDQAENETESEVRTIIVQ